MVSQLRMVAAEVSLLGRRDVIAVRRPAIRATGTGR